MEDVEQLKAEVARWTRRVKVLEARLDCIAQISQGRHDEASQHLTTPGALLASAAEAGFDEDHFRRFRELEAQLGPIPSPAMLYGTKLHAEIEKAMRGPKRRRMVQIHEQPDAPNPFALPPGAYLAGQRPFDGGRHPDEYHSGTEDPLGAEPRLAEEEAEAVEAFAQDMLQKLRKNAHKAHWRNVEPEHLIARLQEELQELESAMQIQPFSSLSDEANDVCDSQVRDEAVDVANFAMMLWDYHSKPRPPRFK